MNTDQIAMCYISIDTSRQALQTNGKLISNSDSFLELNSYIKKNNGGVGFMQARWGGICAEQHASNFLLILKCKFLRGAQGSPLDEHKFDCAVSYMIRTEVNSSEIMHSLL